MSTNGADPSTTDWNALTTILEAVLAFGILMAVLIAVGSTEAGWPIALGIMGIALLYHLLNHAHQLSQLSGWISSKVA